MVPTVEKKPLQLVLPYLGNISLQTRPKFQSPSKGYLTAVKIQNKFCSNFCFKDSAPQILTSVAVHKFQCGLCNEF